MNDAMKPSISTKLRTHEREFVVQLRALLNAAFDEGRNVGWTEACGEFETLCRQLLDQLESIHDSLTPEMVRHVENMYASARPTPIVAARFGAAGEILTNEIRSLAARHPVTNDGDGRIDG